MGYNPENYRKIREEYESKPQRARDAAKRRADELHERFETVAQIDRVLAETGPRILGEALKGREGLDDRIARLRAENEECKRDCEVCEVLEHLEKGSNVRKLE